MTARAHGQYCPVTLGSEVIGDRWTPLILREMLAIGSTRFNDIERGLPGISRTLLAQRLRHLERQGVVERVPARGGRGSEYRLTPAGEALEPVLVALGEWAIRWRYSDPEPEQVDPVVLTWWMHRLVRPDQLPDERVVVRFDYREDRPGSRAPTVIWLVLDRGEPSVCLRHPGFETDVVVTTTPLALMRVFSGIDTLDGARREGTVSLDGPPTLTRRFGDWFSWSPFAPTVREVLAERARSGRAGAGSAGAGHR